MHHGGRFIRDPFGLIFNNRKTLLFFKIFFFVKTTIDFCVFKSNIKHITLSIYSTYFSQYTLKKLFVLFVTIKMTNNVIKVDRSCNNATDDSMVLLSPQDVLGS